MSTEENAPVSAHAPMHVRLMVKDAAAMVESLEALGFTVERRDAVFTQLRWAPGALLYVAAVPPGMPVPEQRGAGVLVGFTAAPGDVERVAGRARLRGLAVDGPREQPWHTLETVISAGEGYRLLFMERVQTAR